MRLKPPHRPEEITGALVEDLRALLGPDLIGVGLFGSAAGPRYRKGVSDINLMLLVSEAAGLRPSTLIPFCRKWAPARVATPLLLTPDYLATSRDVFPVELLALAHGLKMLQGPNPLANLTVDPGHLRLQLERELKGKLIALRTRIMAGGGEPALTALTREALPAFGALLAALCHLLAGEYPQPAHLALERLAEHGVKVQAFRELDQLRHSQAQAPEGRLLALWEQALAELAAICHDLDQPHASQGANA
ncbi:MAG: hypothetical protein LDL11_06685 [Desulfarculus sp.]|nr:hypothetical protein [Desulfarculus sp.]